MPNFSSNTKYCFRKPGATTPALGLAQSFWALTRREIPIETSLEEACREGFEYFEVGLSEDRLAETKALLDRFPLKLIAQGWAPSAGEATVFFQRAAELGAIALNLHLGHAYLTTNEAVDMIGQVQRQAEAYGIPLLLETHRGRLTQDLFRTVELLARIPEMVITLDLSHYIVASENLGGPEELFRAHITPLLARAALIHGRISNGQASQVRVDDAFAFTSVTQSLWRQAMKLWLAGAPADAVLIFEPELGPPPYAFLDPNGAETFSRTAETRRLTQLAREAWAAAHTAALAAT